MDARTEVRLNDILGHFERVRRDAEAIQSDLDNLTQIYFSVLISVRMKLFVY